MKKLVLGLGSVAAIAAPIATVVACGSDDKATTKTTNLGSHKVSGATVKAAFASGTTAEFEDITAVEMDTATSTVTFKAKVKTAGDVVRPHHTPDHVNVGDVVTFKMTVNQSTGDLGRLEIHFSGVDSSLTTTGATALKAAVFQAVGAVNTGSGGTPPAHGTGGTPGTPPPSGTPGTPAPGSGSGGSGSTGGSGTGGPAITGQTGLQFTLDSSTHIATSGVLPPEMASPTSADLLTLLSHLTPTFNLADLKDHESITVPVTGGPGAGISGRLEIAIMDAAAKKATLDFHIMGGTISAVDVSYITVAVGQPGAIAPTGGSGSGGSGTPGTPAAGPTTNFTLDTSSISDPANSGLLGSITVPIETSKIATVGTSVTVDANSFAPGIEVIVEVTGPFKAKVTIHNTMTHPATDTVFQNISLHRAP